MEKHTNILLSIGLILALISTGVTANIDKEFVSNSDQRLQQHQSMVSTDTVIRFGGTLLERSPVAQKLKFSGDVSEKAHYENAVGIYEKALKAYEFGNDIEARKLALQAIHVIASSVPRHYRRVAGLTQ